MNTTLDIGTELFREIGYLVDDENSLKKMLAYARKLVAKKKEAEVALPSRTKEDWVAELNEVCEQIKLARSGKLKGRPLEEVLDELSHPDLSRVRQGTEAARQTL